MGPTRVQGARRRKPRRGGDLAGRAARTDRGGPCRLVAAGSCAGGGSCGRLDDGVERGSLGRVGGLIRAITRERERRVSATPRLRRLSKLFNQNENTRRIL